MAGQFETMLCMLSHTVRLVVSDMEEDRRSMKKETSLFLQKTASSRVSCLLINSSAKITGRLLEFS